MNVYCIKHEKKNWHVQAIKTNQMNEVTIQQKKRELYLFCIILSLRFYWFSFVFSFSVRAWYSRRNLHYQEFMFRRSLQEAAQRSPMFLRKLTTLKSRMNDIECDYLFQELKKFWLQSRRINIGHCEYLSSPCLLPYLQSKCLAVCSQITWVLYQIFQKLFLLKGRPHLC